MHHIKTKATAYSIMIISVLINKYSDQIVLIFRFIIIVVIIITCEITK